MDWRKEKIKAWQILLFIAVIMFALFSEGIFELIFGK